MKIVFILSAGHSGSTLLDLLLDAHSRIVGVGEMQNATPDTLCACGLRASACPLWVRVFGPPPWSLKKIVRSKLANIFGRGPFRSRPDGQLVDEGAYAASVREAYERVLEVTGASILVDSSKSVERAELVSRAPQIEPLIIHLTRDGRAVTWSYMRKYRRSLPHFFVWAFENLKIEFFRRRYKGPWLFLRYEDLVADPARELTRICKALDIRYEPGMLDFRRGERHQVEGNRMRLGGEQIIHADEAWRREMPRSLRGLFALVFGWLNAWYRCSP